MTSSVKITQENLPTPAHPNHGRTKAAWVTNGGITLGSLVASVGVAIWDYTLLAAGGGVIALSLIVGGVMKARGLGQPK